MCWATPSSEESSPIVLKAPGAFPPVACAATLPGDPVAEDLAGAEGHHPPRRDRHFDAGLRIAADALALVTKDEAAKAGDLHIFAVGERMAHAMQDSLDELRRFGPRKAEVAMDNVGQVSAC